MNKYVNIKGSTTPLLLLESEQDVDNAEMGTAINNAHQKITAESSKQLRKNPNDIEARTRLMNMMFLASRKSASNLIYGGQIYKDAIKKFGAILVNPKGGYQPLNGLEIVKQWDAQEQEGAIC